MAGSYSLAAIAAKALIDNQGPADRLPPLGKPCPAEQPVSVGTEANWQGRWLVCERILRSPRTASSDRPDFNHHEKTVLILPSWQPANDMVRHKFVK